MNPIININERVDVVAIFNKQAANPVDICIPRKIRFRGQEIALAETGLRHPTVQGKRMIHVFDVTDGNNDYRLEFDAEGLTWTLVSMLEGHYDNQN